MGLISYSTASSEMLSNLGKSLQVRRSKEGGGGRLQSLCHPNQARALFTTRATSKFLGN